MVFVDADCGIGAEYRWQTHLAGDRQFPRETSFHRGVGRSGNEHPRRVGSNSPPESLQLTAL